MVSQYINMGVRELLLYIMKVSVVMRRMMEIKSLTLEIDSLEGALFGVSARKAS